MYTYFIIFLVGLLFNNTTQSNQIDNKPFSYWNKAAKKWECGVPNLSKIPIEVVDSLINLVDDQKVNIISDTIIIANSACHCHIIGIYNYMEWNNTTSIKYYKKAVELRQNFDDGLLWKSYKNLGIAQRSNKTYFESIKTLEKINPDKLERAKDKIQVYRYLAQNYDKLGEYEKALENAERAINVKIVNEDDYKRLGRAYLDYSNSLTETEDTSKMNLAIQFADSAMIYLTKDLDKKKVLNNKAIAYVYLKEYNKAFKIFEEASDFETEKDRRLKARVLTNKGILLNEMKLYADAIISLNTSLDIKKTLHKDVKYHFDYAPNYNNIGESYLASGKLKQALNNFHWALCNISNNFKSSDDYSNPKMSKQFFVNNNIDFLEYLDSKGKTAYLLYKKEGIQKYLDLAKDTYETAFDFHSSLYNQITTQSSRLIQAKTIMPFIENALKVQYEYQQLNKDYESNAFKFMELNKASVLMQSINESQALKKAGIPVDSLRKEKSLRVQITEIKKKKDTYTTVDGKGLEKFDKEINILKDQHDYLFRQFESNYPSYKNLKYQSSDLQLREVQNQLDTENAILQYFIGDNTIYVMTIQKEQVDFHQIKKPLTWENDIKELSEAIIYKHNNYIPDAYALYQLILDKPLSCLNDEIKHVQIIPDAELNTIPFAALLTNKHQVPEDLAKQDFTKLSYLANQFYISYAYSNKLLLESQKEKVAIDSINNYASFLSQDNIVTKYCSQYIDYIPKGMSGKIYKNEACNPYNFRDYANKYSIVNLTMHGCGKLGSLSFTDEDLFDTDIYNLDLSNNQLIYLTACETNVGTIEKGEGVMSLSRAFIYAGCPSLVSTLWSVHPESTCVITVSFFKHLQKGNSIDIALWEAQKEYINNVSISENIDSSITAHPYYWAGIIPIGNTAAIIFKK